MAIGWKSSNFWEEDEKETKFLSIDNTWYRAGSLFFATQG